MIAYCGEANFNTTKAAQIAGYAATSHAIGAIRRLPHVTNETKKHLNDLKWQGLAHWNVRIERLMRMIDDIEFHEQRLQSEGKYERDLWNEKRQIISQIRAEAGDGIQLIHVTNIEGAKDVMRKVLNLATEIEPVQDEMRT